jgi:hypothetical protein
MKLRVAAATSRSAGSPISKQNLSSDRDSDRHYVA